MTITASERKPAAERIAVRCVDSDVHPMPKRGQLVEYLPEPWRTKYWGSHTYGELIYYDAPDYAHSYAMRLDTFPSDGEFACSDPDLAFKQLIMEAGSDIAILEPGAYPARLPEADHAMSQALNSWQANHWLDSHNNWHERWRGSICVSIEAPAAAAAEIESVGGDLNAATSVEYTCYTARVLGSDLPLAVDILADILQHSSFDPAELERIEERLWKS